VVLFLALLASNSASAEEWLEINEVKEGVRVTRGLSSLVDPHGEFSIEQISRHAMPWQDVTGAFPNFGFSSSYYWLRLRALNTSIYHSKYRLQLEYPLMDEIEFYFADATGRYVRIKAGDSMPFSSRHIKDRMFTFDIELPRGIERTFYLRIKSTDTVIAPLVIHTLESYENVQRMDSFFFGLYYGALIVIIIYNSLVYLFVRDNSQLFYVLLIGSYAFIELSLNGTGNVYLWGEYPAVAKMVRPVMLGVLAISAMFVTKAFLNLPHMIWHRLNFEKIVIVTGLVSIVSPFILPFNAAIQFSMVVNIVASPIIYATGIYQWRKGNSTARYFTLGWSGLIIGGVVNVMRAFGLLPVNFWTTYSSQIGSVVTMLTLNMALTDRMRALQGNKDKAQQLIIDKQEEANRLLDQKVRERTEELQRKSEEAERARELSEAGARAKSQFLATMSHEIRTPMNGVIGMTQLLEDTSLTNQQVHYVNTIKNSGEALLRIINDILDYSKIEAGKLDIENIAFSVRALVDECMALFAIRAATAHTRFFCNIDPDVPDRLLGDPTRIRQIIINLLSNAFKFTERGLIVLEVFRRSENSVGFRVTDSGIGIPATQQSKLFEPFSQADSSTTRKFGGTGLGLAICKLLVELMGGQIGVISEPGMGSTFWFTLHIKTLSTVQRIEALHNKRVLVADNDKEFIRSIANLLTAWGAVPFAYPENTLAMQPDAIIYSEYLDRAELAQFEANGLPKIKILQPASSEHHDDIITLDTPVVPGRLHMALLSLFKVEEAAPTKPLEKVSDFSRIRVLVAEDNEVNRLVITGLLKKFDIVPDMAVDGLEAVAKYEQAETPYHLILMDCEMPNLDGYGATQRICASRQLHATPTRIFGLSAHALAEYRDKAMAAGMDGFLTKPVKLKELEKLLNELAA